MKIQVVSNQRLTCIEFGIFSQCRFSINFSATPRMGEGDILFHLNPRPSEGVCIRNALLNGSWGAEEKWQPYFPFDDGRSFSIKIEVTNDAFRTFVNGRPFVDFLHRADFRAGKYLILREGAEYYDVIFQSKPVSFYCLGQKINRKIWIFFFHCHFLKLVFKTNNNHWSINKNSI